MNRLLRTVLLVTILGLPAGARAVERGDILVTEFGYSTPSSIGHYGADGTYLGSYTGAGIAWEGADTLPSGFVVTTVREPTALVRIFGDSSFATPEVESPGDIDVFSDGTIAVADQRSAAIELYSATGVHIRSISSANQTSSFGMFIDASDHLWAADLYPHGDISTGSGIYEYDQLGNLLRELHVGWNASDLVVDHNGHLWVANWWEQKVMHLDTDGNLLGSFEVPTSHVSTNQFWSIALDLNGNILAAARQDSVIFRLSPSGELLQTIPRLSRGEEPGFMTVVGYVPEPATYSTLAVGALCLCASHFFRGRRRHA